MKKIIIILIAVLFLSYPSFYPSFSAIIPPFPVENGHTTPSTTDIEKIIMTLQQQIIEIQKMLINLIQELIKITSEIEQTEINKCDNCVVDDEENMENITKEIDWRIYGLSQLEREMIKNNFKGHEQYLQECLKTRSFSNCVAPLTGFHAMP